MPVEQVTAVVASHRAEVSTCFSSNGGARGRIRLYFRIVEAGDVRSVDATPVAAAGDCDALHAIAACVQAAARHWLFAPPAMGIAEALVSVEGP